VRISLGRDPETGKRRYHNHTVHGKRRDAETYRNGVLRDRDLGNFITGSTITVKEFLDQWLDAAQRTVAYATHEIYKQHVKDYVVPHLGYRQLRDVRPADIEALVGKWSQVNLSASSIHTLFHELRAAFNKAVRWKLLANNPCTHVDLPKYRKPQMLAMSPEQASRFVEQAKSNRYGTLFILAIFTGMRPSELAGLKWQDIDFERGFVSLQRNLVWLHKKGESWKFGNLKTEQSRRAIPLPPMILQLLETHRRTQQQEIEKAKENRKELDLVFTGSGGNPVSIKHITRYYFKPLIKELGLPSRFRLYDLRHSCATVLFALQENVKVISERLGHSRVQVTLDRYIHVLPTMQQQASDKLEKSLLQPGTQEAHTPKSQSS